MQPMTPQEAIAGVALLAMDADGVLQGEEDDQLRDLLLQLQAFDGFEEEGLGEVLASAERRARKAGFDAFLAEARVALDEDGRAAAFAVAADVVCADDTLGDEESTFLARIEQGLGLSPAVTDLVLETLGVTRVAP